ncbi:ammonium transporter [Actinocorallia sp. A-T 12471]|uniref:ammonium transporter n=1 Tax=Actinocorallia sp. A-T 12471 TaxID=3089813 RepID=UPI0029CD547A|nr:ammonium transporter [Actinocorallia sp. A-T 12471]MDX6741273.1 ammonium transporter [Actinocorallia sp. A-T 12471]
MPFDFSTVDSGATAWVLASSALVLFMTPGVAFLYGGMVRAKNVLNTMLQSFTVMALVGVTWVSLSYSLAFGGGSEVIGGLHFAGLSNMDEVVPGFTGDSAQSIPPIAFAMFQMMFAIITPALITGSAVERWRFGAFVPFVIIWSIVVYAPVAHWVFSPDGWAYKLGALDFAGGTVVHCNAGAAGLAIAIVIGRRTGWPRANMAPHNVPFIMLGVAMLWFGWFGFNAGSALKADAVAVWAFVNTNTATAAALLTWVMVERIRYGKPTALGAASGAVAGLVAITPAAGFVDVKGALAIGLLAGFGCCLAVPLKSRLKLDDSLDVAGLHLVGGVIGSVCVGLFATSAVNPAVDGLLYGGDPHQLVLQIAVVGAVTAYSFFVTYFIALVLDKLPARRNRVSSQDEAVGLDFALHGETAYETQRVPGSS